jgi:pimeloyl-ACP methyl ester carboxylesterase
MEKTISSLDGTRVYYVYEKGSSAKTLVFLHGLGGNWTVWKKEMDFLNKKGFSTIALDFRGHGKSDVYEEFEKYQLPFFSQDIRAVLDKEKVKEFVLIGHSLGGGVAINYCMTQKTLSPSSMVLIETACTYPFDHNRILNHSPYITHLLRFIAHHQLIKNKDFLHLSNIDLSEEGFLAKLHLVSYLLHITPLRTIVKVLDNAEEYAFKNQQRINETLSHLKIPLLLIAGAKDNTIPPRYSEAIKELNKKAKLKILDNATHTVIIERADDVAEIINNFLSGKIC